MPTGIPGGSINGVATSQLGGIITASDILSPFASPSSWDSITIGGLTWGTANGPAGPNGAASTGGLDGVVSVAAPGMPATPSGYVVIEGAERRFSWDPKHGKSQEGWTPTYQGTKGKQFKIKFRMWTDAQFQYWLTYRKMFDYLLLKIGSGATPVSPTATAVSAAGGSGGTVNALSVSNPKLAMLGIRAIYVEVIHELKPVGDKLEYETAVDVWEFRPPPARNATATANGASGEPTHREGQPLKFEVARTPGEKAVLRDTLALAAQVAQSGKP